MKSASQYLLGAVIAVSLLVGVIGLHRGMSALYSFKDEVDRLNPDLSAVEWHIPGTYMQGTRFIADGYWWTAKHVQPDADQVGQDSVRLSAAPSRGLSILIRTPMAREPISVILAPWPGVKRIVHGVVLAEETGDGLIGAYIDTPLFPGTSGSPILDKDGYVIGTMKGINLQWRQQIVFSLIQSLEPIK